MNPLPVKIDISRPSSGYEILIGDGLLNDCGEWSRKCLGNTARKLVIVSNPTIFDLYGKKTERSLKAAGFSVYRLLITDGERYKTLRTAEIALNFLAEHQISRTDAVVALGGGVVGDLAGFAAAIYQRGISFLQIPTTLLSMIDSSVGGKTGVNSTYGKNQIGAFHQPRGVLIDVDVLGTLPPRELTAGFCEMIKHGAIGSKELLARTDDMLNSKDRQKLRDLIAENVTLKARIVASDEMESPERADSRSRKVLNFGHTLAHALEKVTDYRSFKHGEAVGHGILFAAELSKSLDLCGEKDVRLLNDVVHRAGSLPRLANIGEREVFEAFKSDKKYLSGSLQMVLLRGIGKPLIVKDIPRSTIKRTLKLFLQNRS